MSTKTPKCNMTDDAAKMVIPWAPADGRMSMPAGCLAAKSIQKKGLLALIGVGVILGAHITTLFAKSQYQ